jgi:hypothetical protein
MKPEELPEDSIYEHEESVLKDLLAKYFGGEIPTEKQHRNAVMFLYKTTISNNTNNTQNEEIYD